MKKLLFILLAALPLLSWGRIVVLTPQNGQAANGHPYGYLWITGSSYGSGDTIYLRENGARFYWVGLMDINPTNAWTAKPLVVQPYPDSIVHIGDTTWHSGMGYNQAFKTERSHYFKFTGNNLGASSLILWGSTDHTITDVPNNYEGNRGAYLVAQLDEFSDHAELCYFITYGGNNGLWIKKEVKADDGRTWASSGTRLRNFNVHHITVTNSYGEGMYLGHTSTYWNIVGNYPVYWGQPEWNSALTDSSTYKQAILIDTLYLHDNLIDSSGNDGYQLATITHAEIYNNEVTRWANLHKFGDEGGLLIGGRMGVVNAHDNYIHDGWGEMLQFYGDSTGVYRIYNNLFARNQHDGCSLRGMGVCDLILTSNSVIQPGKAAFWVGASQGMTNAIIFNKNLIVEPITEFTVLRYFYNDQQKANIQEGTGANANGKFSTLASADLNVSNRFQPNATSPALGYGYSYTGGTGGTGGTGDTGGGATPGPGWKLGSFQIYKRRIRFQPG